MSSAQSSPVRLKTKTTGMTGRVLLAFGLVYFFWGSTYTAIRIAGEFFAPPLVGALRCLLSTVIFLGLCLARGTPLRVSRRVFWQLAIVGILLMSVNNVLITWAETMVPSGLAALLIATTPILVAVIERLLPGGEAINKRGWAGTLLGTLGMVALISPSLHRGAPAGGRHLLAYAILLLAALAFAVGSVLARRFAFKVDTFVATGYQIGVAGLVNLLLAIAAGNLQTAAWTRSGILAIVYLSVFGTVVGLTAYTYLLQHVPVTKVSTYAFVNPVIAVLLGVFVLGERLDRTEVLGMAIIVAAVAMVILSRTKRGGENATAQQPTGDMAETLEA